jgi:NADPH-dependent 2,4-dienoyl-CoA reductase/sulfur reductase-like enzyme
MTSTLNKKTENIIIIGAGPAAMAAGISAYDNGKKPILLERGDRAGGILNQCIHSGFGLHYFKEELTGPEYAHRFVNEINSRDIEIRFNTMVTDIKRNGDGISVFAIGKDGVTEYQSKAVILAMGCRERTRGAINIAGSRPSGIYTAGTAQYFVNIEGKLPGREVVILGSGDIGLIMARRMTLEGARVKMVCEMMPHPGGLARNVAQCLDDYGIPLRLSTTVTQIHGNERLTGVTLSNGEYVPCDTLLLSVGLIPENELSAKAGVAIDPLTSGAIVDQTMETSVHGIFACGNVVHVHDLADNVTVESLKAGKYAALYIEKETAIDVVPKKGVCYVVPQKYCHIESSGVTLFYMRSDGIYRNVKLLAKADGRVIKTVNKVKLSPSEMEAVEIDNKLLIGTKNIEFEVAE